MINNSLNNEILHFKEEKMKTMLAFDIDDTLNVAKTPITEEMANILAELLTYYDVCAISGQKFDQFLLQIVEPIHKKVSVEQLKRLHLMVAQGTQYYKFSGNDAIESINKTAWKLIYSHPLEKDQIDKIIKTIEQVTKELGYWCDQPKGEIIEDRISQVTFSALGQSASTDDKYKWDQDRKKRQSIVNRAKSLAPEFDYEIGGTTSINIFLPGMNKTFGMDNLIKINNLDKKDILYFGDMTMSGGNDYPVVQMGIDTITVEKWQDTAFCLKGIIAVSKK